jgi:hypothetical protein
VHEKSGQEGFVAHFWLVAETDDKKEANLVTLQTIDNLTMLSNNKEIKAGEKLIAFKSQKRKDNGPVGRDSKLRRKNA